MAGRLTVYAGEPESYVAFISPEACVALDKYLDFRRYHGEIINGSSPLLRDKFDVNEELDNKDEQRDSRSGIYDHPEITVDTRNNGAAVINHK